MSSRFQIQMTKVRRRKYDPLIIERTIGLALCLSTSLYRSVLECCTLDEQGDWDYMTLLRGDKALMLWLLVETPSAVGPELVYRLHVAYPTQRKSLYVFIAKDVVLHFYKLSALVGCWFPVSIRRIIYKFLNASPFHYTAFAVSEKVGIM